MIQLDSLLFCKQKISLYLYIIFINVLDRVYEKFDLANEQHKEIQLQ